MKTSLQSISPQDDSLVGEVEVHDRHRVYTAVENARSPALKWGEATSALERSAILHAAAAELSEERARLVDLIVREVGKPVTEARAELERAEAILRFYAQMCLGPLGEVLPADRPGSTLLTRRRPHGVVGLITPWNFPVAIPIWKAAPALAVGNAIVLKPSPDAAITATTLAEILNRCLPSGVLTVVHGAAETGSALTESVDALSFTGSTNVGMHVVNAASHRGVPVQAEMGGHNPTIVLPDADVELAAAQLANAIAGFSGQKCTATRRVITIGSASALVEALSIALDEMTVGDPSDEKTTVGPVINTAARQRIDAAVHEAIQACGAKVATRRGRNELPPTGSYVEPTLLTNVKPDAPILRNEVFGPVVSVIEASNDDEAVRIANDVDYGLVAAVIGTDLARANRVADQLHVGMVKVNEPTTGVSFHGPFGGEKGSSIGQREQGREALEMYTWKQTVTITPRL